MNSVSKAFIIGSSLISIGTLIWSTFTERSDTMDASEVEAAGNKLILQSTSLPTDSRFNPTIANGFLGHSLYSNTIYMNGLYNGEKGDSHRARIPGTLPYINTKNLSLKLTSSSAEIHFSLHPLYSLNLQTGTFIQTFETITEKDDTSLCSLSQRFYAHRYMTRILVSEINIECIPGVILTVPLDDSRGKKSNDLIIEKTYETRIFGESFTLMCGRTRIPEQPNSNVSKICYAAPHFPEELVITTTHEKKRFTFTYISSISGDKDDVVKFLYIAEHHIANATLFKTHESEWTRSWDCGSIEIESSNKHFDLSVTSGLYYLLSAFPPLSMQDYPYEFFGASPGGLTNGGDNEDYLGHVFWDQDFWMLPALLPLFPDTVEHALRYRIARLESALTKAKSFGFQGAFYPWESAYTGADVCPGETYVNYEQHITGDIIYVLKQYIRLTAKWDIMHEEIPCFPHSPECYFTAWNLTYQTARFWFSRFAFNEATQLYAIENVMGPDEYHAPVNNSAFTNIVAMQNLKFAVEAADRLHMDLPERDAYLKVANNAYIPYSAKMSFHPEYDGFTPYYDIVKQADTIMLGFPLGYNMSFDARDNDLNIYSYITDPNGPAMTWSMFSINLNEREQYVAADGYFLKQFDNIHPPFQIWSESSDGGGAVNFLTGLGGYLQSILYGYLQLRIYDSYVTLKPHLPPTLSGDQVDKMAILGLKIHGVSIDVTVIRETYSIRISKSIKRNVLVDISADKHYYLGKVDDAVTLPTSLLCYVSVSAI